MHVDAATGAQECELWVFAAGFEDSAHFEEMNVFPAVLLDRIAAAGQVGIAQNLAFRKLEFTSRRFAIRLIYMAKRKSVCVVNASGWRNCAANMFLTCSFV